MKCVMKSVKSRTRSDFLECSVDCLYVQGGRVDILPQGSIVYFILFNVVNRGKGLFSSGFRCVDVSELLTERVD